MGLIPADKTSGVAGSEAVLPAGEPTLRLRSVFQPPG